MSSDKLGHSPASLHAPIEGAGTEPVIAESSESAPPAQLQLHLDPRPSPRAARAPKPRPSADGAAPPVRKRRASTTKVVESTAVPTELEAAVSTEPPAASQFELPAASPVAAESAAAIPPVASETRPESLFPRSEAVPTATSVSAATQDLTLPTAVEPAIVSAGQASEPAVEPLPVIEVQAVAPDSAPSPVLAPAPIPAREPVTLNVAQRIYVVALGRKREALQHLLGTEVTGQTLVYTRTKHGADKISRFLERVGFKAAAIHGDKSHGARSRALAGFKSGEITLLVATDIAARALDLEALPVVVNYDLPHIADDYVQRLSRVTQVPVPGRAVSIITQEESPQYRAVRALVADEIELMNLAGFEAAEAFDPDRDPPQRAENEERNEAPAPRPQVQQPPRPPRPPNAPGGRRERGRHDRNARIAPEAVAQVPGAEPGGLVENAVVAAPSAPVERPARPERGPRPERPARAERGPRPERKPRPDRAARNDRGRRGERVPVMRGDEQPFGPEPVFPDDAQNFGDDPTNAVDFSEVEGRIERGNSALPQPVLRQPDGDNRRRRRNGRPDPFAPFAPQEINEDQANIWDERQPDDYRDQWSVLGPTAGRPAWTYADQGLLAPAEPKIRSDAQPRIDPGAIFAKPERGGERGSERPGERGERRSGPRAARSGPPRQGQPRGGQARQGQPRHGRPKRADGR